MTLALQRSLEMLVLSVALYIPTGSNDFCSRITKLKYVQNVTIFIEAP